MSRLVIFRGSRPERYIDLADKDLRIGRAPENDIVLEDAEKSVSRFHAELRKEGQGYVLVDLNSSNGVWQDGQRVPRAMLTQGRPATVGLFRVVLEQAPVAQPGGVGGETMILDPQALQPPPATGPRAVTAPMPVLPQQGPPPPPPPTPPAPPKAAAPARPPLQKKVDDAPKKNIISIIAQPKIVLSIIGMMLLLIVGRALLGPSDEAPPPSTSSSTAPQVPAESNEQLIAKYLKTGQEKLDAGEFDTAIEEIGKALLINPEHPQALELKIRAEEKRREVAQVQEGASQSVQPPPETQGSVTPPPVVQPPARQAQAKVEPPPQTSRGRSTPVEPPAADQGPRTRTPAQRQPRQPAQRQPSENAQVAEALRARYDGAKVALEKGNFAEAAQGFEAVLRASPGYQDAPALLARARAGARDLALRLVQDADQMVGAGDFPGARRTLDRAAALDASVAGLDEVRDKLRARAVAAGENAFRRARQYDAVGRGQEALPLYEQAVQLLPEDHPSHAVAVQRVNVLKAGGR